MKKIIFNALKIIIPFGIGIYLTWYFYNALTNDQKDAFGKALTDANYFWFGLSMLLGWLSHLSRAYRWKYLLEPLGHKPRYWNAYHSTMIGYIINLTIPRSGEVSRAGFLGRYEKIPVDKSFGTIIAERVIDLIMLGLVFLTVLILQYDMVIDLIKKILNTDTGEEKGAAGFYILLVIGILGITGIIIAIINVKIREKVIGFIKGIVNGVMTVFTMQKKWQFIGHTLFIWAMYLAMFFVCFQGLAITQPIPSTTILAAFIAGTIGVIITPGGLGLYPWLVAFAIIESIPASYNITNNDMGALEGFGWLIWASQNSLIVICGLVSLLLMPRYNRHEST